MTWVVTAAGVEESIGIGDRRTYLLFPTASNTALVSEKKLNCISLGARTIIHHPRGIPGPESLVSLNHSLTHAFVSFMTNFANSLKVPKHVSPCITAVRVVTVPATGALDVARDIIKTYLSILTTLRTNPASIIDING